LTAKDAVAIPKDMMAIHGISAVGAVALVTKATEVAV